MLNTESIISGGCKNNPLIRYCSTIAGFIHAICNIEDP